MVLLQKIFERSKQFKFGQSAILTRNREKLAWDIRQQLAQTPASWHIRLVIEPLFAMKL